MKCITGEDSLDVSRKYLTTVSTRLKVRFTLAVNELPEFADGAGALGSRLMILPFENTYEGREDRGLEGKLTQELPGIFNWAIDGLARLRAKGKFTEPSASEDVRREFERVSSPVTAFIKERCILGHSCEVSHSALWTAWEYWCEDNGVFVGSREVFGRRLRPLVPHFKDHQHRVTGGKKERCYIGIGLRTPES